MQLTGTQQSMVDRINSEWSRGDRVVMATLPTGGGKTVVVTQIIADYNTPSCLIAHRQELVGQISIALAYRGIYHRIIGPTNVVKHIVSLHMEVIGKSFYNPQASCAVAGVDTLLRRARNLTTWMDTVTLYVLDEGHHVLRKNKWGKAAALFPRARGLLVSALAYRADGAGLGSQADGIVDTLVTGPCGRDMINQGYLNDYRIFVPSNDLDLSNVDVSKTTGDYVPPQLRQAVHKSSITGDVVEQYKKRAGGKLGITFGVDVEHATELATAYNSAGIRAEVISGKTPDRERAELLRRFKRRDILQLCNVDLFGEGFDLPALEVASFARPTHSYAVYMQQFGRPLRPLVDGVSNFYHLTMDDRLGHIQRSRKPHAIIIDHVGNVVRHGLPDRQRTWTLDRRDKRTRASRDDVIPVRTCPACTAAYERTHSACPYCGYVVVPADRSRPSEVDGDLYELDPATLSAMRGDVELVDTSPDDYMRRLMTRGCPPIGQMAHVKRHKDRQDAQTTLREVIAWWAGVEHASGRSQSESYKRFFWRFGTDVLTAQTLRRAEAIDLAERIAITMNERL